MLFCSRPHPRYVDYETSRFVVTTACGLNVSGSRLERGDEMPRGALSANALRLEYQAHHIETAEYAKSIPALAEACASRGVSLEPEPPSQSASAASRQSAPVKIQWLGSMSRKQLVEMCEKHELSSIGNKDELVERLSAVVA